MSNKKTENKDTPKIIRSRSWFFTIWDKQFTTEICYDNLHDYITSNFNNIRYFCYNLEKSKTGQQHIHLYIELGNATNANKMKKVFPKIHIEQRKGTPAQARSYIIKPVGMFFGKSDEEKWHTLVQPIKEYGDFSKYADTDIEGSLKLTLNEKMEIYINEFDTLEEIEAVDLWFAKQFRNEIIRRLEQKKKDKMIKRCGVYVKIGDREILKYNKKIYYLQGDSRVGKTFGVYANYDRENVFRANCSNKNPFDKYNGQSVLMLDEFRGQLTLTEMLSMTDCYDFTLPRRFSDAELLADTIIISSNLDFEEQYKNVQEANREDYQAFKNRFVNGIWDMCYDKQTKKRYVHCSSTESDFTNFATELINFSDPPIYCDNESIIHIKEGWLYSAILNMIEHHIPTTEENLISIIPAVTESQALSEEDLKEYKEMFKAFGLDDSTIQKFISKLQTDGESIISELETQEQEEPQNPQKAKKAEAPLTILDNPKENEIVTYTLKSVGFDNEDIQNLMATVKMPKKDFKEYELASYILKCFNFTDEEINKSIEYINMPKQEEYINLKLEKDIITIEVAGITNKDYIDGLPF